MAQTFEYLWDFQHNRYYHKLKGRKIPFLKTDKQKLSLKAQICKNKNTKWSESFFLRETFYYRTRIDSSLYSVCVSMHINFQSSKSLFWQLSTKKNLF